MGGGVRSREMSHWIVGSKPVVGEFGEAKFELCVLCEGERKARHVPHIPQSVRASPMMLASFASFGASALVDSARTPARCCRRALACKMGINTLAPYWMSCDTQSALYGKEMRRGGTFTMNNLLQMRTTKVSHCYGEKDGKAERNALATVPCAEIANEMVQRLGWVQVAECAQGDIFDSIELLVGLRHGGYDEPTIKRVRTDPSCTEMVVGQRLIGQPTTVLTTSTTRKISWQRSNLGTGTIM